MNTIRAYFATAFLLLSIPAAGAAERQPEYPARPIRFVVPFAPGGSSDIQARIIAQKMSEHWRTTVIVDNRPSAGGIAACEIVVIALC